MLPFNKPYLIGSELDYIAEAVAAGQISGNGIFTKKCHEFFQERHGLGRCFLTTSCTDALEMAAILCDIEPGDEVIMPSFTFPSTANAFVLRGARIVFADSSADNPNIDAGPLEELVTERTKAIVPVHYAGVACDMDAILDLARRRGILVVEDAAQAVYSFYKGRPLGSLGDFGTFSFHETKNVISGEGGMLVVNDERYVPRAEIVWEKGTNRAAFFRGEVVKYEWVDIGSSFLPSDIIAAFLYAQLEHLDEIQKRRKGIWQAYHERLSPLAESGRIDLPVIPKYATNNAHLFYILCASLEERTRLIAYLKEHAVQAVFHYQPLHQSPYYADSHDGRPLPNCVRYSDCLLRLPFYFDLTPDEVARICDLIVRFYGAA